MQGEPAVDVQRHRQGHRHLPDQSVQECGLIAKRRCGGCITGKASDNLLVEDNHVVLHPIGHESCGVYVSQGARAQHRRDQHVDQRVLAVYFTTQKKVEKIANYGIEDGKVFDFISRTTPTGGAEQGFLRNMLKNLLRF